MINVKVGDRVERVMGGVAAGDWPIKPPSMSLRVSAVTETEIICGPWRFNRETGGEIDEEIGWDGVRITGSIITLE